MFSNAKIGDRVWSIQAGWGKIYHISKERPYPIEFKSDIGNKRYCFTYKGMYREIDTNPTLFWNEFKIPEEAFREPLPKLEIDTKVLVWGKSDKEKHKRYFSHFDEDGKIYCFEGGATSWSKKRALIWGNWELYDESEDNKN